MKLWTVSPQFRPSRLQSWLRTWAQSVAGAQLRPGFKNSTSLTPVHFHQSPAKAVVVQVHWRGPFLDKYT